MALRKEIKEFWVALALSLCLSSLPVTFLPPPFLLGFSGAVVSGAENLRWFWRQISALLMFDRQRATIIGRSVFMDCLNY